MRAKHANQVQLEWQLENGIRLLHGLWYKIKYSICVSVGSVWCFCLFLGCCCFVAAVECVSVCVYMCYVCHKVVFCIRSQFANAVTFNVQWIPFYDYDYDYVFIISHYARIFVFRVVACKLLLSPAALTAFSLFLFLFRFVRVVLSHPFNTVN